MLRRAGHLGIGERRPTRKGQLQQVIAQGLRILVRSELSSIPPAIETVSEPGEHPVPRVLVRK